MDNLILPTICILFFMAFLLFSLRKQLTSVFRGDPCHRLTCCRQSELDLCDGRLVVISPASDKIGVYPTTEPIPPVDVHATMYHALGTDPHQVITDPFGRPFGVCTGSVIRQLL
jgi:hypothetical protein